MEVVRSKKEKPEAEVRFGSFFILEYLHILYIQYRYKLQNIHEQSLTYCTYDAIVCLGFIPTQTKNLTSTATMVVLV